MVEPSSTAGIATIPPVAAGDLYPDSQSLRDLIRQAIYAALPGSDPQAPLRSLIEPGMTVLLKPNWVMHINKSGQGLDCLVTNPEFILAALQAVAACRPGRVILGDAPVQGCRFDELVSPEFRTRAVQAAGAPLEIHDFRRTVARDEALLQGVQTGLQPVTDYVHFDLGCDSLLEPVSQPPGRFRVTNYDPRFLARAHHPGRHEYLLRREAFEADVILNLPKLKTHKKSGLTAALKNLVGLNGNKDYLPHHRLGGSALGGDCYAGIAPLKRLAEFFLDQANQRINRPGYAAYWRMAQLCTRLQARLGENPVNLDGSWYGNDTVWRMTLDLNRMLLYGRSDGTMSETPLRQVFSLCDGVIAGQGEGPLSSVPLALGAVTFSNNSALADLAHAALLRLDWHKIPLLRRAYEAFRYPLAEGDPQAAQFSLNGAVVSWEDLARRAGQSSLAPAGWRGQIEWRSAGE